MYPIIKLAKNIALSNFSELQAPYKLTYAVTYRCQLQCGMCNIWRRGPFPEMDLEQIEAFFRKSGRFSWINLSGGEIFLREDLLRIIGCIDTHCTNTYLLNFPTNGYQTDLISDTVETIVRSYRFPKMLVTVSLDGPPELHDRIRGVPGSWGRAVETYRRLRKMRNGRFDVFLGMTLQGANVQAFEATVQAVRERIGGVRYRDVHVNVVHASEHYYTNPGCSPVADRIRLSDQLARVRNLRGGGVPTPVRYLERRYQRLADAYLATGRTPVGCQALAASLFLDPAGTVYPCSIFNRPVGSLKDHAYRLDGLWNAARRRSIRQEVASGDCPHCWTPCEAYQSMLADLLPTFGRSRS